MSELTEFEVPKYYLKVTRTGPERMKIEISNEEKEGFQMSRFFESDPKGIEVISRKEWLEGGNNG